MTPSRATGRAPADRRPVTEGPLVEGVDLVKHFPLRSGVLQRVAAQARAVDRVNVRIEAGETLGLVGESGSGKSTLGRVLLHLIKPTAGTARFRGVDLGKASSAERRRLRRHFQMIFQDPFASFDPKATITESVGEPLRTHEPELDRAGRRARVAELLEQVGMDRTHLRRYPHQFSGGQLQRLAIARAISVDPDLVVCDEPVSSLDVSTQAQVINLLVRLQRERGLAYLFIAHDLSVVRHVSHRIAVMYLGRIVEVGDAEQVYNAPTHPYTQALLSAIPVPDPVAQRGRERIVLHGDIPSPTDPPSGCRFRTRCPYVMDVCAEVDPPAYVTPEGTTTFCHLHTDGPRLAGRSVDELPPPTRTGDGP